MSQFDFEEDIELMIPSQIDITDESSDPIRSRGSVHRGAAYLEDYTYPPFGNSNTSVEGDSMSKFDQIRDRTWGERNSEDTLDSIMIGSGAVNPYSAARPQIDVEDDDIHVYGPDAELYDEIQQMSDEDAALMDAATAQTVTSKHCGSCPCPKCGKPLSLMLVAAALPDSSTVMVTGAVEIMGTWMNKKVHAQSVTKDKGEGLKGSCFLQCPSCLTNLRLTMAGGKQKDEVKGYTEAKWSPDHVVDDIHLIGNDYDDGFNDGRQNIFVHQKDPSSSEYDRGRSEGMAVWRKVKAGGGGSDLLYLADLMGCPTYRVSGYAEVCGDNSYLVPHADGLVCVSKPASLLGHLTGLHEHGTDVLGTAPLTAAQQAAANTAVARIKSQAQIAAAAKKKTASAAEALLEAALDKHKKNPPKTHAAAIAAAQAAANHATFTGNKIVKHADVVHGAAEVLGIATPPVSTKLRTLGAGLIKKADATRTTAKNHAAVIRNIQIKSVAGQKSTPSAQQISSGTTYKKK